MKSPVYDSNLGLWAGSDLACTDVMRFNGKLSKEDLNEVRRFVRPKMYWPKLIASNLYGFLLLGAIAWATVDALGGKTHPNWTTLGGWPIQAGFGLSGAIQSSAQHSCN